MRKWQDSELCGSRDCVKPHQNQPIKPFNQEECTQDTTQLNCDPGAGRHIAMKNYKNFKMSCNLILIESKWKMTPGNSGTEFYGVQSIFPNFLF